MSRTLRKITNHHLEGNSITAMVDETKAKHIGQSNEFRGKKMSPFGTINNMVTHHCGGKYKRREHRAFGTSEYMGNTRAATKLENKNANRSLKKKVRQHLKKELSKEINELNKTK